MAKTKTMPDLNKLSTEEKLALLDSLYEQLGIQAPEIKKEPVKKKRGRPKKVVEEPVLERQVTSKSIRGNKTTSIIADDYEKDLTDDEKRIREASKKLNETRVLNKEATRSSTRIVKVECKNCKKEYSVAENFPNLKNFICCRR